jgi:hypothetical protein
VVGPQAYHETFPSSLGTKGTGAPGFKELWTVMDAIENTRENRCGLASALNEGKKVRMPARERIQPLAGDRAVFGATYQKGPAWQFEMSQKWLVPDPIVEERGTGRDAPHYPFNGASANSSTGHATQLADSISDCNPESPPPARHGTPNAPTANHSYEHRISDFAVLSDLTPR